VDHASSIAHPPARGAAAVLFDAGQGQTKIPKPSNGEPTVRPLVNDDTGTPAEIRGGESE
jgi:hypothetical protein